MSTVYRKVGPSALFAKVADRLSPTGRAYRRRKREDDRHFDAAGYDTGGIQHIYGMDVVGTHAAAGGNHIAVPPDEFGNSIASLNVDPTEYTFIDLGSGKGRAVLLAADMHFAQVIGVEFARELHQVAEANLALWAKQPGNDTKVRLLHADATTFEYPEAPTVLFIFNSFDPPVLTAVIRGALRSWRASPRPFRVIYLNPVHLHDWIDEGWRLLEAGNGVAIYAPPEDGHQSSATGNRFGTVL